MTRCNLQGCACSRLTVHLAEDGQKENRRTIMQDQHKFLHNNQQHTTVAKGKPKAGLEPATLRLSLY